MQVADIENSPTGYYATFLNARIYSGYRLCFLASLVARMPRRRGAAYRKIVAEMEEGLDLIQSTSEEVQA